MKNEVFKPRILVDFDGVLHEYVASGGWQGHGVINGPPKPGALAWLNSLLDHFEVCVYSTRSSQVGGLLAMQRWLKNHWPRDIQLPLDSAGDLRFHFPREKLPAKLTIDDRCLRFAGAFPAAEELLAYRAYDEPGPEILEKDARRVSVRHDQLVDAAHSYRRLAEEDWAAPPWRAQLLEIARQVDALRAEINRALPVVERPHDAQLVAEA